MIKQTAFRIPFLITIICYLICCPVAAQTKATPDSTCILSLVENLAFTNYANTRISASINSLNRTTGNDILYLIYSKHTGVYKGLSLILDETFKVSQVYRFAFKKQSGLDLSFDSWSNDSLNLKTLFIDSACYMNDSYQSEGTDEMLIRRRNGVPVSGLIYKGCSGDPATENSVYNKTLLQLLIRCRSKFR
jgi:hypothetical protein